MFFNLFIQVVLLMIGLPLLRVVFAAYECGGSSVEWFVGH